MFDSNLILYMVGLTISLVAGTSMGYILRNRRRINLNNASFAVIVILIFSLGFSVGSNGELLDSLPKVGLNAIVIALLTIAFSLLFVKAIRKTVRLK
ncbi:lysine exporter LysO family protein [Candidatus Bathyarchaeota archaeon]|nr:lysine exporter LysO family protein [Candidatus Bathyarchaeota archaeon]